MKTKIFQSTLLTVSFILALPAAPAIAGLENARSLSANRARPESPITEVVGGLHSPRGLAIGPGGQLFVAQAGDDTASGSIIEILNPLDSLPIARTLVSGLPVSGEEGEFVGVDGISIFGNGVNFGLYAIMAVDPQQTGDPAFGNLLRVDYRREVQTLVNVGSFDYEWTAEHTDLVGLETFPMLILTGCWSCPATSTLSMLGRTRLTR